MIRTGKSGPLLVAESLDRELVPEPIIVAARKGFVDRGVNKRIPC